MRTQTLRIDHRSRRKSSILGSRHQSRQTLPAPPQRRKVDIDEMASRRQFAAFDRLARRCSYDALLFRQRPQIPVLQQGRDPFPVVLTIPRLRHRRRASRLSSPAQCLESMLPPSDPGCGLFRLQPVAPSLAGDFQTVAQFSRGLRSSFQSSQHHHGPRHIHVG